MASAAGGNFVEQQLNGVRSQCKRGQIPIPANIRRYWDLTRMVLSNWKIYCYSFFALLSTGFTETPTARVAQDKALNRPRTPAFWKSGAPPETISCILSTFCSPHDHRALAYRAYRTLHLRLYFWRFLYITNKTG